METLTGEGYADLNGLIGESVYRMREERIKEMLTRIIASLKVSALKDIQGATSGIEGNLSEDVINSRE